MLWPKGISLTWSCLDFAPLGRVHGPFRMGGVSATTPPNHIPALLSSFLPYENSPDKSVTHFPLFHRSLKFSLGFGFSIFFLLTDWVMFFISVDSVLPCPHRSVAMSFSVFLTLGCFSTLKFPLAHLQGFYLCSSFEKCSWLLLWTFLWHPGLTLASASSCHWLHWWSFATS